MCRIVIFSIIAYATLVFSKICILIIIFSMYISFLYIFQNGSAQLDSPTKLLPLPETRSDFNSWMETTEPLLSNTNTNNGKYIILQPVKAANSSTITDDYIAHDSNRDSLL